MRVRSSPRFLTAFLALSLGLTGCASGGGGGSAEGGPRRGSSNRIVADELAEVQQFDLFTAINRLRPTWLRAGSRGTLPGVIVDGTPQAGGVEALRTMRAADVGEVEFMNSSDATTRFGTGYSAGAIVISTRR